MKWILPLMLLALLPACSGASANGDVDPKAIEAKYGLTGGYVGEITNQMERLKPRSFQQPWRKGDRRSWSPKSEELKSLPLKNQPLTLPTNNSKTASDATFQTEPAPIGGRHVPQCVGRLKQRI